MNSPYNTTFEHADGRYWAVKGPGVYVRCEDRQQAYEFEAALEAAFFNGFLFELIQQNSKHNEPNEKPVS